ncbi:putative RNA-directed DNA polymerase [Tanacetum coccineum]|uniref:RNA-directed DNA polymerase n=1 Tax=Tanacetum coccineum TaxID=301880 RepID=A0ABQ4XI80_9ASTR
MSASTLTSNTGYLSGIEPLTGTNFSTWRDQVKLTLGVMDLDHALCIDPPAALTTESTTDQKRAYEQWERSNRLQKPDVAHVATINSNKRKGSWKGKGLNGDNSTPNKILERNQRTVKVGNGVDLNVEAVGTLSLILEHDSKPNICHISRDRMTRLVKDEVLPNLDFSDFEKYHGIINQYTMPGTPQQNGAAERINRTLMDMPTNFDDYYTYLNEADFDLGKCNDPESFEDTITCNQSAHWREAMEDELNSMTKNNVWELAELRKGAKPVGCKWVYKTKLDPNGNVERYKAHLVAKGYTQKEGVDYKETLSPVSRKDSLRIVMALVAHFDLELHQMDVKTAFLNVDLHEDVYMAQPQGFKSKGQEHLVCKLKKSIYGLKQASRQWYLKFDKVMKKHNFIKNKVDQCVYLKMSGSNFIILVLYVDDILLASNNIDLLHESKRFLSRNFDMKDLGEASYVIGIEIHRDRANGILGLSQKAYIERTLNRFNMQHFSLTVALVIKGDVFGSYQCPKTEVEYEEMRRIPYASVVGSLTYAQVCTRPDIAYICGMLGRFQSNPGLLHWKAAKKTLRNAKTLVDQLWDIFSSYQAIKDYCDNNAAVSFSNSNSSNGAGLYLDTKYLFVHERVEEQRISIEHIRTHEILAHPLTKGLPPKEFQGHVAKMGFRQDLT